MVEYWIGFSVALLSCVSIGLFANTMPVEAPMLEHCASYESELQSYDNFSFDCSNGATFDRDILDNK